MSLYLVIREGALFENAVAELVGFGIDMATLRFSPEGMSLSVDDGSSVVAALRILADGGGCDWFHCLESASATLNITTLLEILFEANDGKSFLYISINPDEENKSDEPNTSEEFMDVSSPSILAVSWFDPEEIARPLDDSCVMHLEVRKVAGENALLKLDETRYQTAAGISAAGFTTLFWKLKDARIWDKRTNDRIKVMALISNTKKLGFYTCSMGWVHEEEGGIEVKWEGQGEEGISMGMYNFAFLCKRIFAAREVKAQRMYFHIQDGVTNLLRCPLGSGQLGDLYFYSLHSRVRIPLVDVSTFAFVSTL